MKHFTNLKGTKQKSNYLRIHLTNGCTEKIEIKHRYRHSTKLQQLCALSSLLTIFFLETSLQTREIKAKINKWDYICTGKDTTNQMKRQTTEWKKTFANDTSYKGLIYKYTNNTAPKKWAENMKQTLFQR